MFRYLVLYAAIDSKTITPLIRKNDFYSKILEVELDGKNEKLLPKDVQFHPVNDNVIHIDFMRVQGDTKVTVEVPVNFLNRESCPGIKKGGVLNTVRRVVGLNCNASQIPDKLEFDLINSEIGDSVKISNFSLPEGVKPTITDRDFVIATLVPPTVEAEPETEAKEGEEESEKTEEGEDKKDKPTESSEKDSSIDDKTGKKEEAK